MHTFGLFVGSMKLLIKSSPGEIVKLGQYKTINDEGMPQYQKAFLKGSLYISLNC